MSRFFSRQDAGYAAHILQIPSVALLTTAGPGSMAAAMYLNLNRFSDAIFLRSLCPMHIYIYEDRHASQKKICVKHPFGEVSLQKIFKKHPGKDFLNMQRHITIFQHNWLYQLIAIYYYRWTTEAEFFRSWVNRSGESSSCHINQQHWLKESPAWMSKMKEVTQVD